MAAPPAASHMRFGDAEEQASALAGWNQTYLQLSPGAFKGEVSQVQVAGVRIFVEHVQQSVLQTGVLADGVLALGIPLQASAPGMFCGTPCASEVLHVFSGLSGFEFRPAPCHTMLGIELQLGPLCVDSGGYGDHNRHPFGLPSRPAALALAPKALARLRHYLLGLLVSAQSDPALLERPAVLASVADHLLDQLPQDGAPSEPGGAARRHWQLVQQACERIHERLDQPPTVAQLCLDLGVSRRTLQSSFLRLLDTSPLAYLKTARLHQARRMLKQLDSVTDAATSCGFWHFGHFAQDYLALFGERPSQTLRRYHGG